MDNGIQRTGACTSFRLHITGPATERDFPWRLRERMLPNEVSWLLWQTEMHCSDSTAWPAKRSGVSQCLQLLVPSGSVSAFKPRSHCSPGGPKAATNQSDETKAEAYLALQGSIRLSELWHSSWDWQRLCQVCWLPRACPASCSFF